MGLPGMIDPYGGGLLGCQRGSLPKGGSSMAQFVLDILASIIAGMIVVLIMSNR
jgi:hypothetical protein